MASYRIEKEYEHHSVEDLKIQVLRPHQVPYKIHVSVDMPFATQHTLPEFKRILKWLNERVKEIEKNFDAKGNPKSPNP